MHKVYLMLTFFVYILFIDYCTSMFIFDYKKYIKKDKFLKDMKFSLKWKEQYAERKAIAKLKKVHTLDFMPSPKTSAK